MAEFKHVLTKYLEKNRKNFDKMIFVTGPRQVGKTTLLKSWSKDLSFPDSYYLSWDIPEERRILRAKNLSFFREKILSTQKPLFLLDEIHKFGRWKNFLKGLYDALKTDAHFAITGSARMNVYRRGGDSLMGRYWLFHLFPLTVAEILGSSSFQLPASFPEENPDGLTEIYPSLWERGGFPEPFFSMDEIGYKRWVALHKEILIREDLRDLSRIQDLAMVENLLEILPTKIGSPLSLNSIREDLEIGHTTLQNWLKWLEHLYYFFSISAYSKKIARSLKKEKKIYLYDWAELGNLGARFENLVALHLLKAVYGYKEMMGERLQLCYLRDKEKREVDFLVVRDEKPWMMLEAKFQPDADVSSLHYYSQRLNPKHIVLLTHEAIKPQWKFYKTTKYWLSPASTFFSNWL